jgi:superfamily I DNA and/or RNA helicase
VSAVLRILDIIAAQEELVEQLLGGDDETPIGVVCMYSGQKRKVEFGCAGHVWPPRFRNLIRVDTVDAYQGKENAIVLLSLVRSNPERVPGHVRSDNRCNVAISRAKERLIIVGAVTMWKSVVVGSPMRRVLEHIGTHPADAQVIAAEALQ